MIDGLSGDMEPTRMINDSEKLLLLKHRVGELELQVEVIKKCTIDLLHDKYFTTDHRFEPILELKPLINPNISPDDIYIEKQI